MKRRLETWDKMLVWYEMKTVVRLSSFGSLARSVKIRAMMDTMAMAPNYYLLI